MSRVTPPISKLSRSISSTPAVARPSRLLGGAKVTSDAAGRKRQSKKDDSNLDDASRLLTTNSSTSHRPVPARAPRKVPLMQGFRTSAPVTAAAARHRHDPSRVDNMVLPRLINDAESVDPYAHVRVPLVWDVSRAAGGVPRAAEQADGPLMRPEISVVAAAGPAAVLPSALTEVEGMGVDGVELKFVHEQPATAREDGEGEQGMIRDIWKGLMDDVFGNQHSSKAAA